MGDKMCFKADSLEITQYDGSKTLGSTVVDESKTIAAVAVARPGNTSYRQSTNSNNSTRVLMMGDVAIYSFKHTGEHEEGEGDQKKIVLEGEIGQEIMSSKSFMVLQTKDPTGVEREPFVRTPWDIKQSVQGPSGNIEPPSLSHSIKLLADEAINMAGEVLSDKIERGENIRAQSEYARLASSATKLAKTLASRRPQQAQSQNEGQVSDGAVTANDLGM